MKRGLTMAAAAFALMQLAHAQAVPPTDQTQRKPTDAEQEELMRAVSEGSNSTLDLVRVFEAFLQKHPDTMYRPDIELNLTRASIENKDDARVVRYGEKVLARSPDDVVTLDKVAQSLVTLGGKENAEKALKYARAFEDLIAGMAAPEGANAPQIQEERDRAQARMLITQARAQGILNDQEEGRRMTGGAYGLYP